MIAKEWRDARWKLALGALAFLVVAVVVLSSYKSVLVGVERDTRMMERELEKPIRLDPTATPRDEKIFERQMREDVEKMREPDYPAKAAGSDLEQIQRLANYAILIPLAGLLGVALVSGEVAQGSIFLLLSKPMGRRRMLLTKYAVCAACLFAVALVGAVGMIVSAFAHGYPSEAVNVGRIFTAAVLMWIGSLFVLGVSLLSSVLFRSVIPTILAATGTIYLVHTGPDIVRGIVETIFWTNASYERPWREMTAWYDAFESWRLSSYWGGFYSFNVEATVLQSFMVCLLTAVPPLLLALWVFRRRAY